MCHVARAVACIGTSHGVFHRQEAAPREDIDSASVPGTCGHQGMSFFN